MNEPANNNKGLIFGIIAVTVLIFAGLVWAIVSAPPSSDTPQGTKDESVTFSDGNDPFKGKADAPVIVRMYGDFQCPACLASEPAVRYAIDKYGDRVKFIWKDFPLLQVHPNARKAANAARCAEAQGKFWEYHDKLYATQGLWEKGDAVPKFLVYAGELGLEPKSFTACLSANAQDDRVAAGLSEGFRNSVDRTPTYFINNRRFFSMSPTEWDAALQSALSSVQTPSTTTSTTTVPTSATGSGT